MPLYRFTFADGSTSSANPVFQSRDDSAIFTGEVLGAAKVERLPEPPEPVVIWEAPAKPKGYVVTYVAKGRTWILGESYNAFPTREAAQERMNTLSVERHATAKIIDLSQ